MPENTDQPTPDSNHHSRIHPSLRDRLLGVNFDQLTPQDIEIIFSGRVENVLRDLIRDARMKGLLP